MDKRAIMGIALSILVLVVYQEMITRFYAPPPAGPVPVTEKDVAEKTTPPSQTTVAPSAPAQDAKAVTGPVASRQAGKDITVETENYAPILPKGGGRIKILKKKNYPTPVKKKTPP